MFPEIWPAWICICWKLGERDWKAWVRLGSRFMFWKLMSNWYWALDSAVVLERACGGEAALADLGLGDVDVGEVGLPVDVALDVGDGDGECVVLARGAEEVDL